MQGYNPLIKKTLIYSIYLIIFNIIYRKLSGSFHDLSYLFQDFNYKYIFLAIFFSCLAIVINTYTMYLVYKTHINLNFFYWNLKFINSLILDHIPFLGTFYRAKKLKKKYNLKYTNFVTILFFLIIINYFLIIILINFFK